MAVLLCTPQRWVAADDLEALEPDLECAVCLAVLCEPVSFPGCSHSFCRLCLLRVRTLPAHVSATFRCPLCRCSSDTARTLTVADLVKWPVSAELKSRAAAAAPELYQQRSQEHAQKIATLLADHAAKRMQDRKCLYRAAHEMRGDAPLRFRPGADCLHTFVQCVARCWCGPQVTRASTAFGYCSWRRPTPPQGSGLPSIAHGHSPEGGYMVSGPKAVPGRNARDLLRNAGLARTRASPSARSEAGAPAPPCFGPPCTSIDRENKCPRVPPGAEVAAVYVNAFACL